MESDSLNDLFFALSNPDNEIRNTAESFVQSMLNEEQIEFIEKILDELTQSNPNPNQIKYSFIIINKSISFYNNYQKVIDTSLLFFGNENEQIRILAVISFCLFSREVIETKDDQSPIDSLISMINTSNDINIIESSLRSIGTFIKTISNTSDNFTNLSDLIFNFFLESENIKIDTFLILIINDIIANISDIYFTNEQIIQKLLCLIEIYETKPYVYMVFDTFFDYFYSSCCMNEVILQIMKFSCQDMSEISNSDTIMRIVSFWNQIAQIELEKSELVFHYVNLCGEQLTPFFLNVLSTRYEDCHNESIEEETDWTPLQLSRETIFLFCEISPSLISPILFEFIEESDDLESIFYVLSILTKVLKNDEDFINQIPTFLNNTLHEITSSNDNIRYSAFYALNAFASIEYIEPNEFEPFFEIFSDEWTDIRQIACKSFKIFAKLCSKMPIENQSEYIIQVLQNIDNMPIQYISYFLDYINKYNMKIIAKSENIELIYNFILFFCSFLEKVITEIKLFSAIQSTTLIFDSLFIDDLDLSSIFSDILNLLMIAFTEYSIFTVPLTISRLFLSDKNSALPHLSSNVNIFISILNDCDSLSEEFVAPIMSSLILILFIDDAQTNNDIYECMCNILMRTQNENEENIRLIILLFEFFHDILFIRQIDDGFIHILFNYIHKYFSLQNNEIHDIMVYNSNFYEQILDFANDLISECPQVITPDYFKILVFVCNTIKNLEHKTEEIAIQCEVISIKLEQFYSTITTD